MNKTLVIGLSAILLAACSNEANQQSDEQMDENTEVQTNQNEASDSDSENDSSEANSLISEVAGYRFYEDTELIEQTEAIEKNIQNQWANGDYTPSDPLVIVDPYEVSPYSALVMFETDQPARVEYRVVGNTEGTTLGNSIDEENTIHEIPIFGLYAGKANTVELQLTNEDGSVEDFQFEIETEALPETFYDLELIESQPEQMQDGVTFFSTSGGEYFAVDEAGEVRYLFRPWMLNNVEHLENGNIVIVVRREHNEQNTWNTRYDRVLEVDYLGRPYNSYIFDMDNPVGTVHFDHDLIELDNGNILALVHDGDTVYEEDGMIEFNLDTGEIVNDVDFKDMFPADYYEDYYFGGEPSNDWMHHNSIWQTADGNSLLVSGRNHDLTFKMTYPENEFEWILTADENWENTTRPDDYLLEPIGEVKFPMAQHAVEEMPDQDGNPNTIDIMLFDNNRYMMRGHEEEAENYSRAAQYRIDEEAMTVEEIWSYGEERGKLSYTSIVSDADYFEETNNVLVTFGRAHNEEGIPVGYIVEVDKETNEVLFEYHVTLPTDSNRQQVYRSERLPMYPENYQFESILN